MGCVYTLLENSLYSSINAFLDIENELVNFIEKDNIAITTKSTMALNIVRRYQNNMIESQKSTDHDTNNDRKRHGQTQFTNT